MKLARKVAQQNTTFGVRLGFAIQSARVEAAMGNLSPARAHLEAVLGDATKHGYLGLQFETRLALSEFELESGKIVSGRTHLGALEKDATSKGFLLIAHQAASNTGEHALLVH